MAGSSFPRTLMPHPGNRRRGNKRGLLITSLVAALVVGTTILSFPSFLAFEFGKETTQQSKAIPSSFPVSVNPDSKTIVENPSVDALFEGKSALTAAAATGSKGVLVWIASLITSLPGYTMVAGSDTGFVTIYPGYRQEQVADAFGRSLGWSERTRSHFLSQVHTTAPTLLEGEFPPGTYVVHGTMTPIDVQNLLGRRFDDTILSRYSTTTASFVPLDQALTIASLLERETSDPGEMRIISGIIWNRIFKNMNLQIDATLQYAKSTTSGGGTTAGSWWPKVVPKDKYIKSAYNTYAHAGLPPTPIANPSIAAVLAALNPKPTDCIFYFHDKYGNFHCSATYEGHVTLLKKYYGQGK